MKEVNLVSAIRKLEEEKREIQKQYKENIAGLDIAIAKCRELNTVCEKCNGVKGSECRACAEADREWHKCSACNGSGKAK